MSGLICRDGRLTDPTGAEVRLHGVNMVCKDSHEWPWRESDFAYLHSIGHTFVRLGLVWAYLEPRPGEISTAWTTIAIPAVAPTHSNGRRSRTGSWAIIPRSPGTIS